MAAWLRMYFWNLVCGLTRCAAPLATFAVWVGLLACQQGRDVLRRAVERQALDEAIGELISLGISSALLGLALWYSMRWLLIVQFPGLYIRRDPKDKLDTPAKPTDHAGWLRRNIPRLFGALAPAVVSAMLLRLYAVDSNDGKPPPGLSPQAMRQYEDLLAAELHWALIFGLIALGLLLFTSLRSRLFGLDDRSRRKAPRTIEPDEPLPATTVRVIVWAILLTWLAAWIISMFPLSVGRIIGSASLGAFALAGITLFASFVLTFWPLRRRLPNLVPLVLVLAAVLTFGNEKPPTLVSKPAVPWPQLRSVEAAYDEWRRKAPGDTYYVVATEGGGIRAAYWTAAVLEALEKKIKGFPDNLFAISSVSGGSVGSGMWLAGLRARHCWEEKTPQEQARMAEKKPLPNFATRALAADFLSPTLGLMFYPDALSSLSPWPIDVAGRSRGLEEGLLRSASPLDDNPLGKRLNEFHAGCSRLPYALFNATVAESGQRAILSVLDTNEFADVYVPVSSAPSKAASEPMPEASPVVVSASFASPAASVPAFNPSWHHQPVAALMHHSARFPVVSPPGPVFNLNANGEELGPLVRFLDGGYFDNSGIVTALEVVARMQATEKDPGKKIVLIVIANSDYKECLRNGTSLMCAKPTEAEPREVRFGGPFLYEVVPLLSGLYFARDSHVRNALTRAVAAMPDRVRVISGGVDAPLGWALSRTMIDRLDTAAKQVQ